MKKYLQVGEVLHLCLLVLLFDPDLSVVRGMSDLESATLLP